MILYFSGTGNCLAIARQIAERLNNASAEGTPKEEVVSMYDAVGRDLTSEKLIGLVYPTYYFNPPAPVCELVERLSISPEAYVFIVIPCGAQTGNAVWAVERILRRKGISVDYCHKVRVPDCSAIGFGRNPNEQSWKFSRFASRVEKIASDIKARRRAHHYGAWGLAGWLCALPFMRRKTQPLLQPAVETDKCIGCGTCVRICPQANIRLTDVAEGTQKAVIGEQCAQCLSCVHFCPQQAIAINRKPSPADHQYHHPQVRLKDMLRR